MFRLGRKKRVGGVTLIFETRITAVKLKSGHILSVDDIVVARPGTYNENIMTGAKGRIVGFDYFKTDRLGIVACVEFAGQGRAVIPLNYLELPSKVHCFLYA